MPPPNPRHLLNVRIENMSAFADEPDHFVRWLDKLPADGAGRGACGRPPAPSSAAASTATTSAT